MTADQHQALEEQTLKVTEALNRFTLKLGDMGYDPIAIGSALQACAITWFVSIHGQENLSRFAKDLRDLLDFEDLTVIDDAKIISMARSRNLEPIKLRNGNWQFREVVNADPWAAAGDVKEYKPPFGYSTVNAMAFLMTFPRLDERLEPVRDVFTEHSDPQPSVDDEPPAA